MWVGPGSGYRAWGKWSGSSYCIRVDSVGFEPNVRGERKREAKDDRNVLDSNMELWLWDRIILVWDVSTFKSPPDIEMEIMNRQQISI